MTETQGSFINPAQERIARSQKRLAKSTEKIEDMLQALGRDHQVQPDSMAMLSLRIEALIDWMIPRHEENGIPTNTDRLDFELDWHDRIEEVLVGIREHKESESKLQVANAAQVQDIMRSVKGGKL